MEEFIVSSFEKIVDTSREYFFIYINSTPKYEIAIQVLILLVLVQVMNMIIVLLTTKFVARRNMKYSRPYPGGKKILVVGDSTGVGTGAETIEHTISGRLAKDFPHTDILNLSVNGSLTKGVMDQLEQVKDQRFDMIIISTGGNDIWNFTRLKKLARDLENVLERAKEMSGHKVILLFFGNDGSAPFFPFYIRNILMNRTAKVQDVFIDVAFKNEVPLIRLFTTGYDNPFVEDPDKYFAKDGLHPSGEGYWLWYKRMWRIMNDNKYLYYEKDDEIKHRAPF